MASRAISALIFGLCFGLILTTITWFTPKVSSSTCNGQTARHYTLPGGVSFGDKTSPGCDGGTSYEGVGFPFQVKKLDTSDCDLCGQAVWFKDVGAVFGNFLIYGGIGFVFFFIFARSRHKPKTKKNKGSEE